ncbi:MAG TPA: NAD-dependent epimerase [Lentisphaeria bacterium]|nr:MAG: NAD-dependent epimerase [Lentisphaerae bacterium GWF2_38_69]HBM15734.1 NAD-dependent epimerase [Lentisphaeria bacterium]
MKILVSGSKGFIAGYLIEELLAKGWEVVGIDNLSKYGPVDKSYDNHPNYRFVKGDVKDTSLMEELLSACEYFVAGAAMIGGISYFHEFAYDLLAENERITASSFDAAIKAFKKGRLKKISVMSSSMVFESTAKFPTPEGNQFECPPPLSTYGFQKLATEYFAKGAWEQYKLPFTVIRPFNCIGTGEKRALCDKQIKSGNVSLAMSHVVPDLVQKILKGQDPLHILGNGNQIRHYTYGGDLAKGIVATIESDKSINEDFNISTRVSTSVLELAEIIWKMLKGSKPFKYTSDKPFHYDVQNRVPDVSKAKKLLGFEANTSLETALNEIIPWIANQIKIGGI